MQVDWASCPENKTWERDVDVGNWKLERSSGLGKSPTVLLSVSSGNSSRSLPLALYFIVPYITEYFTVYKRPSFLLPYSLGPCRNPKEWVVLEDGSEVMGTHAHR